MTEFKSDNSLNTSMTNFSAYIDIVEKTGKPISRVDLSLIMRKHNLEVVSINRIKFPRLSWSNRKIEEYDLNKGSVLKKAIVAGDCLHDGKKRPFLIKINLETSQPEVIKILRIDDKISEMNFGPYDNGYLIIGLKSG